MQHEEMQELVVEMIDGNLDPDKPKVIHLSVQNVTTSVHFPIPWDGPINKHTRRIWRKIKFKQFPVTVANARTVHKLQGRSIKNLVISTWNYTGNWVYVVLSRCATLNGIYMRKPLLKSRPMSAECKMFHLEFREKKSPKQLPDDSWEI